MPYGELRVDTITFTNGGVDKSITVSGLFASTSGNLTVTGTVSGNTANFVSGVFTTQISGTTITGTTVAATTGTFTTVTGGVATITSGVFAVGSAAAPSISFSSDSNTGIYSPGGDQVAISTNGIGRLFVNSSGNLLLGTATDGSFNRNIVLEGTSSAGVMFRAGGAFKGFFYVDTSNAVLGASTGDIILKPADTERLRITSTGLVGIGTSSVATPLQIRGTNATTNFTILNIPGFLTLQDTSSSAGAGAKIAFGCSYDGTNNLGQALIGAAKEPGTGSGADQYRSSLVFHTSNYASLVRETMRLDPDGRLGIGTTSPQNALVVSNGGAAGIEISPTNFSGNPLIASYNRSGAAYTQLTLDGATNVFAISGTERARIDSSGRLLVGTSSARSNFFNSTFTSTLQVEAAAAGPSGGGNISTVYNANDTSSNAIILGKTRSGTVGGTVSVQSGDDLGFLSFQGADGSELVEAARITAQVDSTPGANDMPGRLIFSTTADGASSPTERLRITSAGLVGIGTSSVSHLLDIHGIDGVTARIKSTSGNSGNYSQLILESFNSFSGSGQAYIRGVSSATGNSNTDLVFGTNASGFGSPVERLRITSAGLVGIGTSAPSARLQVGAGSADGVNLDFNGTIATGSEYSTLKFTASAYGFTGAEIRGIHTNGGANLGVLGFHTAGSERARIDSSGRLLVGTSTARDPNGEAKIESFNGPIAVSTFANSPGFYGLNFIKSRGTSTNVVVQNNDSLSAVRFFAADGTSFIEGARIEAAVDGTPGANDMPGRIVLSTTADGASSPTERMRITNAGNVGIGTTSPSTRLHLQGTSATYIQITDEGDGASRIGQNGTALTFGVDLADGSTERARIDSSGRLLVGTSTSTASSGQTAQLQVAGSARITNGLASSIDVGTIAENATTAITLPRSGMYCIYVDQMNLFALFVATLVGGSPGVRLIYSTATDVAAGLTTEPTGGTYLRLWISSNQLQVKNVNAFTGPYHITALATSGAI